MVGLLFAAGCAPGALDSSGGNPGQSQPQSGDLVTRLKDLSGPDALLIVGTNGGVVPPKDYGPVPAFADDPGTLVKAAAVVGMPVCSVEPQALAGASTSLPLTGMTTPDAETACKNDDLGDMLDRLGGLKTDATVVVVAANAAITVHSTNNGINYFYDADIGRLLRAARRLYVAACIVTPDDLALPSPGGQLPGLSVDEALARCGQ